MCSDGNSTLDQAMQAQAGFTQEMMNTFSTQFVNQQGILNSIKSAVTPMLSGTVGYSPTTLAALNTQNEEGAAKSYANAETATNEAMAGKGNGLPSGVSAQVTAQNQNAAAGQEATGENQIALANANQEQNNYWNALNVLNGAASQENPLGYGSEVSGSAGATASLGNAFTNSSSADMAALGGLAAGAGTALAGAKL